MMKMEELSYGKDEAKILYPTQKASLSGAPKHAAESSDWGVKARFCTHRFFISECKYSLFLQARSKDDGIVPYWKEVLPRFL